MTAAWRTISGYHMRENEPGIAFIGDVASFNHHAAMLQQLQKLNPRLGIVLVTMSDRTQLLELFPNFRVETSPFLKKACELFLSRLRIRAIAILPPHQTLSNSLASAAASRAVSILRYSDTTSELDLLTLVGQERAWQNRTDRPIARAIANKLADAVNSQSPLIKNRVTRLESLAELKNKLAGATTILCLGNGPTSEDERTLNYKDDIIFRANHGWMARPHLNKPHVVFTGTQSSMKKLSDCIIAVYGDTAERVLLMSKGISVFKKPMSYFVANLLTPIDFCFAWAPHRPTSGAVMIATAVALQPKQLVIAGLDMFSHRSGAYASGDKTPNAYTAAHSGEKEALFLKQVLKGYEGKLIILSPALVELLAQND